MSGNRVKIVVQPANPPARRIFPAFILLVTLLAARTAYLAEEVQELPPWVNELRSNAGQAFHSIVELARINTRDDVEGKEYAVIRLQGEGQLEKISDPFEAMEKLYLSNGWKADSRYAADGHGSCSLAYRKKTYICITSVWIDSGCDDGETGHIPSKFWFSIDCRDTNIARK